MYRPDWLAIPLCRWPFPRLCGLSLPVVDLASPKGRKSELLPVLPSSRVLRMLTLAGCRSSQLLSWTLLPYGTNQIQRSTFRQGSTPAFVPPSGFGCPLDDFLPLNPSEPSKKPTAPLGFTPSKPYPWQGADAFPPRRAHMLFRSRFLRNSRLFRTAT
jgi:hypothetical protein